MMFKYLVVCISLIFTSYMFRDKTSLVTDKIYNEVENVYFFNEEFLFEDENNTPYLNTLNEFELLYEESDTVLKIKPVKRSQYGNLFLTSCNVKDVYKDEHNNELINTTIQITETSYIQNYDGYELRILGFLVPMNYEKEYYVFLKKNEGFSKGYYVLTSNVFGIIPIDEELTIIDNWSQDQKLSLEDIADVDIVFSPSGSFG
ncbi:MAG: hypothetical protein RR557_07515, partial [Bacilli bacterium]